MRISGRVGHGENSVALVAVARLAETITIPRSVSAND